MQNIAKVALLFIVSFVAACSVDMPLNPVSYSGVPQKVEPVAVLYKGVSYIVGYRVETADCVITSVYDPSLGAEHLSFGGPGTIDEAKLILLRSEMEEAKAKGARVNFFGDKVGQSDGKIVVVLWRYKYKQYHQIYGQYKWGQDDAPPN